MYPHGCELKPGGKGWKGRAGAFPCSGKLVALFSSRCYTEAEERGMFGFAGRQPLSASLQPWLHFPERGRERGVSCPGLPLTTEPQRIQILHQFQGSDFTQLKIDDLIWEGSVKKMTELPKVNRGDNHNRNFLCDVSLKLLARPTRALARVPTHPLCCPHGLVWVSPG